MELDNLKQIWKEFSDQETAAHNYHPDGIRELLSGKSQHILAKVRENLQIEMYVTLTTLLVFVAIPFIVKGDMLKTVMGIWAGLCLIYLVFYYQRYKLVVQAEISTQNVKMTLEMLVKSLEKYVSIYFWSNVILIPLVHITTFLLIHFLEISLARHWDNPSVQLFLGAYIIISSIWMVWFFKWYLHRTYGNYIEQMKGYVLELEEK